MKRKGALLLLLAAALPLLCGCAFLLERDYSVTEPHTSQAWESGEADVLEAEDVQGVVNGLLTLIGRYRQDGTLRLLQCPDALTADMWVDQALAQVQKETGRGSYAADYILYSVEKTQNCYEISVRIGYRRSEEEVRGIYYATTVDAVADLLPEVIAQGKTALVLHVASFEPSDESRLEEILKSILLPAGSQLPELRRLWTVNYYPNAEQPVILEILLHD